jgi:hypothetical protein
MLSHITLRMSVMGFGGCYILFWGFIAVLINITMWQVPLVKQALLVFTQYFIAFLVLLWVREIQHVNRLIILHVNHLTSCVVLLFFMLYASVLGKNENNNHCAWTKLKFLYFYRNIFYVLWWSYIIKLRE